MKFTVARPVSARIACLFALAVIAGPLADTLICLADEPSAKVAATDGVEEADKQAGETVTVFDTGTLVVPAEMKPVKPANNLIEHEFQARAGDEPDAPTARLTMMASGGGVKANIDRWIGQFSGPNRKTGQTQETKSGQWDVHVIKISGEYAERMGGGPFAGGRVVRHDDYAMLGAILVEPKGELPGQRQYFVKLIGPQSVINANEEAFKKMVTSVGQ